MSRPVKPAATPPPPKPATAKLSANLAAHRNAYMAGGAALVVLLALYARRKSDKTATPTGPAISGYAPPAGAPYDGGTSSDFPGSWLTAPLPTAGGLGPITAPVGGGSQLPDTIAPAPGLFGPDPERPGGAGYLNQQGYLDLNNAANYTGAPLPPPQAAPPYSGPAYAYIDAQGRRVDQAGNPV